MFLRTEHPPLSVAAKWTKGNTCILRDSDFAWHVPSVIHLEPLGHCLPVSLETQKPEHVLTDRHFHSGNFSFLLLSSSLPSLLNSHCMAPVCDNALQLCLQTHLVRIRHSWFRRRRQRLQLTHNRAIRPAHCSQCHFVPALVRLSEAMSQRIKAS